MGKTSSDISIRPHNLGIKEVQYNFLDKMDCLICEIDDNIRTSKIKRNINRIKKELDKNDIY